MIKKTHKVFALATVVGVCLVYNHYTNSHITYDLLPELKHKYDVDTEFDTIMKANEHLRQLALDYFPFYFQVLFLFMGAVMGSEFPDLDHGIEGVVHRGWTHSIWGVLASFGLTYFFSHNYLSNDVTAVMIPVILLGFSIGYASHLIGDYFSNKGINPFYPIGGAPKYRERVLLLVPTYKVDDSFETTLRRILIVFLIFGIPWYLFTF